MKVDKMSEKLNVLVVGAGMYVGGRGTSTYGTILPALNELYRAGLISTICVAATSKKSVQKLERKVVSLRKITGTGIEIVGFPQKGKNIAAYKGALSFCKPDCAIIAVPDHLHYRVASYLIETGVHTLVVKPLTCTVKETKKLINLVERKNTYGAVEFHKRYDEANLKLKDIMMNGKLGDILYINVEYSQKRVIPIKIFKKWVKNTNVFQYLGAHYVDIIYFVTGGKPLRVLATGQKKFLKQQGVSNYDSIQAIIEWRDSRKSKFISNILTNWIDPNTTSAMSDQKIKVVGTMGRYESDQKNRGIQVVTEKEGIEDINPYFTQDYPFLRNKTKVFKGYGIKSIKQFCRDVLSIKHGLNTPSDFKECRPTFKDSLFSTAVVEAVNLSLRNNSSWINVKT